MAAKDAKKIVYRYNGEEKSEEVEVDFNDDILLPQTGGIMMRHGKQWKAVKRDIESSGVGEMKVIRLYLTDKF